MTNPGISLPPTMESTDNSKRLACLRSARTLSLPLLLFSMAIALTMVLPSSGEEKISSNTPPKYLAALDLDGEVFRVTQRDDNKIVVLVFVTTECPLYRQYVPELNRIAEAVPDDRVAFLGVLSDRSTTRSEAQAFRR